MADPRSVLVEFGVELPPETEIRVWDSTAEIRYLVLPMRPDGTEGWSEEALAELIGRDAMIGTAVVERPGAEILPPEDKGRFAVTATATDEYVFRAVPLRNVELTAPYFHSGQVWDLQQAVAIMGSSQLGQTLDEDEAKAIASFLGTLTGEQPKVEYPILPPSTAATPKPSPM